jgi:TonB family protein
MPVKPSPERATFGLLPEPERSTGSFITSAVVNGLIMALCLYVGATAKKALDLHRYEETLLVVPAKPEPPPPKVKIPPPPPPEDIPQVEVKLEAPKINVPKPEPKPEIKPIQMETKVTLPVIKEQKQSVILGPQPKSVLNDNTAKVQVVTQQPTKSAIAGAAMPAQDSHVKFSTKPVHFGQTFGVAPNPNAKGPATVSAIGNPYGGMQGPAIAPHGIVGSTGFGNGNRVGSSAGVLGKVASAGIPPGAARAAPPVNQGKVAAVGITAAPTVVAPAPRMNTGPPPTDVEVISKPQPQYTSEAKQLKVQGDVVLRVNFAANGQVVVQGVVHGLGHGLDEEARRVAQQIRFRPATRNGLAIDKTTTITITFQLA